MHICSGIITLSYFLARSKSRKRPFRKDMKYACATLHCANLWDDEVEMKFRAPERVVVNAGVEVDIDRDC